MGTPQLTVTALRTSSLLLQGWGRTGNGCSRKFQYEIKPTTRQCLLRNTSLLSTGGDSNPGPSPDLSRKPSVTGSPAAFPQSGQCPARDGTSSIVWTLTECCVSRLDTQPYTRHWTHWGGNSQQHQETGYSKVEDWDFRDLEFSHHIALFHVIMSS